MSKMTSLETAVEVVSTADKFMSDSRPMHNAWYVFFVGRHMQDVSFKEVSLVSNKEWQEAKMIVYGDRFDFRTMS